MSRMFFPPVNPVKWYEDMKYVVDYPFGEVPHPDDDEEEVEHKRVTRVTVMAGRRRVSGSEDSDLPVNRGRPRDTKGSSHSYLPSKRGKCKKGYYFDPTRNLCVKY